MKVFFICESVTLAHLTRSIVIANFFCSKGFEVFLASSYKKNELKKDFFNIDPKIKILEIFTLKSNKFLKSLEYGTWPYNYKILKKYNEQDSKLITAYKPDLVIGDFRLSLQSTCQSLNVPFFGIVNAYWHSCIHENNLTVPNYKTLNFLPLNIAQKIFSLLTPLALGAALKSINQIRKELNLNAYNSFENYFCFDNDALYPELANVYNKNVKKLPGKFIGFTNWSPDLELKSNVTSKIKKNAYVSLGSSGSLKVLEQIVSVLNELNVNVILSSANRDFKLNPKLQFSSYNFLPGEKIAKKVDLVITNGGSPSTYQALLAGTPVLGIPSNLDQFLCMKSLEHLSFIDYFRADRFNNTKFKESAFKLTNSKNIELAAKSFAKQLIIDSKNTEFYNNVSDLIVEKAS